MVVLLPSDYSVASLPMAVRRVESMARAYNNNVPRLSRMQSLSVASIAVVVSGWMAY